MCYGLPALTALVLSGCATVFVSVPLSQRSKLNPDDCHMQAGPISNDPEHRLATVLADLPEAAGTCKITISGGFTDSYHEDVKDFHFTQDDISGTGTVIHFYSRWGTATTKLTLLSEDASTGQTMGSTTLAGTETASTRAAPDLLPPLIDSHALLAKAREKLVKQFIAQLEPESGAIDTKFFHDKQLPALDQVIALAKVGHIRAALPVAVDAVAKAESTHLPNSVVGMAYWDRAMIRELLGDYAAAREDIQKAVLDLGDPDLMDELQHIATLEKQGQSAPGR